MCIYVTQFASHTSLVSLFQFPIPTDESSIQCVIFNMSEVGSMVKYHIVKVRENIKRVPILRVWKGFTLFS